MSTREQIAERIREEYRKHPALDWSGIAAAKIISYMRDGAQPSQAEDKNARIYPCKDCGKMRSKAEGGSTFTVCDECWDKHFGLS